MKIDYMDEVVPEYGAALDKCATFGDCMSVLDRYRELFPDALAAAPKNAIEFDQFQRGLRKEREGRFAGEQWLERFGAVMMPALAIQVAEVAMRFHVPWGLAFNRLVEAGRVKMVDGAYRWVPTAGVREAHSSVPPSEKT